jgi:hypothetical protein
LGSTWIYTPEIARSLAQHGVYQDQRSHGLNNGYGPRQDAWIVASFCGEYYSVAVEINRILIQADSGHWFEGHPKIDRFPVGDAPLNPATIVGRCSQPFSPGDEGVVVP